MLGMIKGGAADRAGIRQGDEILKVDGQEISSLSPFKVAGLLQGADGDGDSDSFVELEVRVLWSHSSLSVVPAARPGSSPSCLGSQNTCVSSCVKIAHVGTRFLFQAPICMLVQVCLTRYKEIRSVQFLQR